MKYELFRIDEQPEFQITGEIVAQSYAGTYDEAANEFYPVMEKGRKYLILISK